MMATGSFFFAGGGTGGHIYPAIAVAEQLVKLKPQAPINFFCSSRDIDSQILSKTDFGCTPLPATGLSLRPGKLIEFCTSFFKSAAIAKEKLAASENAVVIGIGGYVAAPVCFAAHKLGVPVVLVNVDSVPGKANRFIARWAQRIFVQFEETAEYFKKSKAKVSIVGCPLRSSFSKPQPQEAIDKIGLDKSKKTLLITGASSGSESINRTVCSLLEKMSDFADKWQVVHLAGRVNFETVKQMYADATIAHNVVGYYDDMADLLAAADLVLGRSGAVSVAEYAAAGCPTICMPYPHHKDMHQYLNASQLVDAGAAIIVDDVADETDRAEWLWEELGPLLKDNQKREEMKKNCEQIGTADAASKIANELLSICGQKL